MNRDQARKRQAQALAVVAWVAIVYYGVTNGLFW